MIQDNMNKKRAYEKPSMKVHLLQQRPQVLQSSLPISPDESPYQW